MRRATVAAAAFVFCLYASTQQVQAHGPGGHAGSGQGQVAAHVPSANGTGGGNISGRPDGGQFHHKPGGGAAGGGSGNQRPNVNQLHPSNTNGINGTSGTSSSGSNGGGSTGSATNLSAGGNMPLAGEIARIHNLEQELRRLKMEEALQLLQQAKQSGDPQLLAKAEQMLQHRQHNHSQPGGNASVAVPSGQTTAHPKAVSGGSQPDSKIHISHTSGGSHPAGHAHK